MGQQWQIGLADTGNGKTPESRLNTDQGFSLQSRPLLNTDQGFSLNSRPLLTTDQDFSLLEGPEKTPVLCGGQKILETLITVNKEFNLVYIYIIKIKIHLNLMSVSRLFFEDIYNK